MSKTDEQFERIEAIIGTDADKDFSQAVATFFQYLKTHLQLPCEAPRISGGKNGT